LFFLISSLLYGQTVGLSFKHDDGIGTADSRLHGNYEDVSDSLQISVDEEPLPENFSACTLSEDEEDVLILDDEFSDSETVIIVRRKAAAPLSPSIRVIKSQEFQGKFSDLPSVLETVSGIDIRSTGGYGQYAESSIRGGSAKGIRVYLDGILLNSASAGAVDLSKLPLERIQEIRITKSTSGLKQMGEGMGGVIELFSDLNRRIVSVNLEAGSYGYLSGSAILRTGNEKRDHQINFDISKSGNNYPFIHDNGTAIPTLRDPDPTWDDTLMRKKNNYYRSVDAAYNFSFTVAENHKISPRISAGFYEQGLFVYYYKRDQSGSTGGTTLSFNTNYNGGITPKLTLNAEAGGSYRSTVLSDPDGRFSLGGAGRETRSDGGSVDLLIDAAYAFTPNISLAALGGSRFERHVQEDNIREDKPDMSRYSYKAGLEAIIKARQAESVFRFAYKHEIDTSLVGFGYWSSDGKKHELSFPSAETVFRFDLSGNVQLQFSGALSKRSPTFFERFGWSSSFLSNPDLKEETRREADAGISVDLGRYSAAGSVFIGLVEDKIKSIPRGSFVKVMNFADTKVYGTDIDLSARPLSFVSVDLSASYLKSIISKAADPYWVGKAEPFMPEFTGFLKTEIDIKKLIAGHGVKYESSCYINIENKSRRSPQSELSAWTAYKAAAFLTLHYRVENYLNTANFDFLDNPKPRRTHVFSTKLNF
jgi:outer membrane receptor for ferrienterochelin and colicin